MPIRPLALPMDLVPAADAIGRTFRYPGHPEWELDPAEQEQFAGTIRRIRRIWPVVRLLQSVSPSMGDLLRGFVWEEDEVLAGFVVVQRDGHSPVWQIEPLGVLPESRRRGIARQVMTEALRMIRSRGGRGVRVGVIEGNAPAQALYRSVGLSSTAGRASTCSRPRIASSGLRCRADTRSLRLPGSIGARATRWISGSSLRA